MSNKDHRVVDSVHYRDVAERLGILPNRELESGDEASEDETSDFQPAKRQRNDQSQCNDSMSLDLRLIDEDQRTSEGLVTSFEGVLSQTPSTSKQSTSKQSTSVVKTSSRPKVTAMSNVTEMSNRLNEQQVNNELQKKYLMNQLERSELAKEREKLMKEIAEIELKKARLLMNEEIEHKKTMMKLEEDAKRAEIAKWKRSE